MNEARPYASLSSGLLARKGAAKPAMRPQNYGSLEDLGWNDMGQGPGQEGAPAAPPEHVPSSITALTPAPKIQRIHPTDAHLPPDAEPFEEDAGEGADQAEQACEEAAEFGESYQAEERHQAEESYQAEEADQAEASCQAEEADQAEASCQAEEADQAEEIHQPEAPRQPEVIEPPVAEEPLEAAAPEPAEAPAGIDTPSVVAQQRAILERFDGEEETPIDAALAAPRAETKAEVVPMPQRAASSGCRKAAFTLRLDAERHLRLRLACAVTRHSAQQIVARALDEALAGIPEIEALASQVPAKPGRAGKRN